METIRQTVGEVTVVRVAAKALGRRNSKELGRELDALAGPDARIVIDLGKVEDIDAAGCGVLLTSHRRLADQGGRMYVCGLPQSLRLPFQLVRMHRRLEVFNTEREALEAFRRRRAAGAPCPFHPPVVHL